MGLFKIGFTNELTGYDGHEEGFAEYNSMPRGFQPIGAEKRQRQAQRQMQFATPGGYNSPGAYPQTTGAYPQTTGGYTPQVQHAPGGVMQGGSVMEMCGGFFGWLFNPALRKAASKEMAERMAYERRAKEINAQWQDYELKARKLDIEERENAIRQQRELVELELEKKRAEFASIGINNDAEIERLKAEYEAKLKQMEEEHASKLSEFEQRFQKKPDEITVSREELDKIKQSAAQAGLDSQKLLEQVLADQKAEMDKLKAKLEEHDLIQPKLDEQKKEMAIALDEMRRYYEEKLKESNNATEMYKSQVVSYESKLNDLEAALSTSKEAVKKHAAIVEDPAAKQELEEIVSRIEDETKAAEEFKEDAKSAEENQLKVLNTVSEQTAKLNPMEKHAELIKTAKEEGIVPMDVEDVLVGDTISASHEDVQKTLETIKNTPSLTPTEKMTAIHQISDIGIDFTDEEPEGFKEAVADTTKEIYTDSAEQIVAESGSTLGAVKGLIGLTLASSSMPKSEVSNPINDVMDQAVEEVEQKIDPEIENDSTEKLAKSSKEVTDANDIEWPTEDEGAGDYYLNKLKESVDTLRSLTESEGLELRHVNGMSQEDEDARLLHNTFGDKWNKVLQEPSTLEERKKYAEWWYSLGIGYIENTHNKLLSVCTMDYNCSKDREEDFKELVSCDPESKEYWRKDYLDYICGYRSEDFARKFIAILKDWYNYCLSYYSVSETLEHDNSDQSDFHTYYENTFCNLIKQVKNMPHEEVGYELKGKTFRECVDTFVSSVKQMHDEKYADETVTASIYAGFGVEYQYAIMVKYFKEFTTWNPRTNIDSIGDIIESEEFQYEDLLQKYGDGFVPSQTFLQINKMCNKLGVDLRNGVIKWLEDHEQFKLDLEFKLEEEQASKEEEQQVPTGDGLALSKMVSSTSSEPKEHIETTKDSLSNTDASAINRLKQATATNSSVQKPTEHIEISRKSLENTEVNSSANALSSRFGGNK